MKKIVKTTTVGSLKKKLNESKGGFTLGQGFGSEPRFKSNVETHSTYNRKLDNNGGFGLGDGFSQLNEEEMVDFIANIVENMKGKTEYHNLKFVDRIANEKGLFESHIKNIKNIIKTDKTPYQLKLRKYLTENVAVEMSDIYEEYNGLTLESEMMVNEIKKTFNEIKCTNKTTNEAVAMTAEALDVPMEMVQKMVEIQKEAYETQMEGGQSMDITEKLCEVYEAYKNMAEGNMKPVYEEFKEMLNPENESEEEEVINPETGEYYTQEEKNEIQDVINRFGSGEPINWKTFGKNKKYKTPEEEKDPDSYDKEYQDIKRNYPLEEELCMECGDDESYIEVELRSPKDIELLRMLGKGSEGSMPMKRPSIDMPSMDDKDENMYEVPMNYSTSNPYKQYKFDTGLSEIPYGKKKFSSLEDEDTILGIPRDIYESVVRKDIVVKVSYCKKYIMVENEIFSTKTGKRVKNSVLVESVLVEGWNILDYAQQLISILSMFPVFGISNASLFINGLVYVVRAMTTSGDDATKYERYFYGFLDMGASAMPTIFGIFTSGVKAAVLAAKTAASTSRTLKILKGAFDALVKHGTAIVTKIVNFLNKWVVTRLLGKKTVQTITSKINSVYTGIKTWLKNLISKAGAKTGAKAGATTVAKLAGKKGFDAFFKTTKGVVKILPKQGVELISKMGFKTGQTITLGGSKYIIKTISSKVNTVTLQAVGAKAGQQIFKNVGAKEFVEGAMKTNAFKSFVKTVFGNPRTYAQGYKFLSGFGFSDNGNIESLDSANMPAINVAEAIGAENMELAGYEGESGQYTSKSPVSVVQTALDVLGKDLGSTGVDGKYGPMTKAAINSAEADVDAKPTTGAITVQTIINIAAALVKANKVNDAKTMINNLGGDMGKNPIIGKVKKIIEDPAITDKLTAIKNAQGGAAGSGSKSAGDDVASILGKVKSYVGLSENTFSENYSKLFGLS